MRALIVTNMYPSPARPGLGAFVRDQVQALQRTGAAEIELFTFAPGGPASYLRAAAELARGHRSPRRGRRAAPYDVVHAHYGLTAWPALAVPARVHAVTLHGTDLAHPRSRLITLGATRRLDLVAAVSAPLAETVPARAHRGPVAVLPIGVDLHRNRRLDRREARRALGLPADRPCLLFPADPSRPEKRFDRARELAGEIPLLTLRDVDPGQVALWINAANAVLVPSEREGFGLATLEALACDVPVLATPVGVAPAALQAIPGALCAPYDRERWSAALAPHLTDPDPRIAGRPRAERWSSDVMAGRVIAAWRAALDDAS
ncbi:MAG TPA: glycosyltransferase [Solirubrobacteraceae bacterium]|nr:glycosyltransferase [Solirubrobacteraceae bacterium]